MHLQDEFPTFEQLEEHRTVFFLHGDTNTILCLKKFTEDDYDDRDKKPDTTPYKLSRWEKGKETQLLKFTSWDYVYSWYTGDSPDWETVDRIFKATR